MSTRVVYTIFRGVINKELKVDYIFTLDKDPESKYRNVRTMSEHDITYVRPNHAISISEGFEKPRLFIPGVYMTCVLDIISKTLKAISEHYRELYPNANRSEFDVDPTGLDKFNREYAVSVNGYSAIPCIYVTVENECKPAIRIMSPKNESIKIPLTDAIIISKKFDIFDADTFGLMLLNNLK